MADFKAVGQYEYAPGITLRSPWQPRSSVDKMKTFQYKEGDIVVASYPKNGQTWLSQMLTLVLSKADTDSDLMKKNILHRVKYMEAQATPETRPVIDVLAEIPPPRIMKSHLPAQIFQQGLQDGKGKFIVVMRNPKDCLVSYFNFYRSMKSYGDYKGTWEDFFELFKAKGLLDGDWLEYNLSWWNERHRKNVLVVKYEDMKQDPRAVILKLASFSGTTLSDAVIEKIIQQSTFESMKSDPLTDHMSAMPSFSFDNSTSHFYRKGTVGDWRNLFTEEQNAFIDEHYTAVAAKQGLFFDFTI